MRKRWVTAVIVAAGEGRRFGGLKPYALLKGKTVLDWCLGTFNKHDRVDEIILVLPQGKKGEEFCRHYPKIVAVAQGGERRQDSVRNGVLAASCGRGGIVLVHDGARPLVSSDLISRVISAVEEKGAAVPGLLLEETAKEVNGRRILRTLDRERIFRAQTPQGFRYPLLREALEKAAEGRFFGTDESSLVERMGKEVVLVAGDRANIKITTTDDLRIAEALVG
jgi:2-C-methyl-D-erythritol 4-phosphate cytidylyltransferase